MPEPKPKHMNVFTKPVKYKAGHTRLAQKCPYCKKENRVILMDDGDKVFMRTCEHYDKVVKTYDKILTVRFVKKPKRAKERRVVNSVGMACGNLFEEQGK